ncbi:MAG TPA: Nif3-like dinuclear metal center hexameric protein, partial [Deltaproteobacteria bacterium]|nr:Nif3-like dinuclear metal center hexameric protein [Deltaproteobacteria bacterium]
MHSEITVRTFQQWLEELAPPELAASWDNVGLQVGHPENRVQKVIISLDPSLSVVNEAIQFQCNLIITHHPLIFKPLNRINLDEPV